jgi:hypothetical protein
MDKNFFLAPKALLASILVSFAFVGVALATGDPPTITLTAPIKDKTYTTSSPTMDYSIVGSLPVTATCGINETDFDALPKCGDSGSAVPGAPLPDGAYEFRMKAVDQYGPTYASTAFKIDTTPPTINITAPANGSTVVDETPTIAFSVTGGDKVECSFDDGPLFACTNAFPAPELSQGQHKFTVCATDPHGNFATASVTFTIDLSAPLDDPLPPESGNVTAGKRKSSTNGRNLVYPIKSQILPSPDVSPTAACKGKVRVSIKPKVRRARTYKRNFKLKRSGSKCVASGKITVPKRYKGKRATLRMYFGGNDWMSKISVVKTIKL